MTQDKDKIEKVLHHASVGSVGSDGSVGSGGSLGSVDSVGKESEEKALVLYEEKALVVYKEKSLVLKEKNESSLQLTFSSKSGFHPQEQSYNIISPSPLSERRAVLSPYYVTGFIDAEGCFHIGIYKHKSFKRGYSVEAVFVIHLGQKDFALLKRIQSYFGVGNLYKLGKGSIQYKVSSVKELGVILDHFDKYPLNTQKGADYELFKLAVKIINRKEHLTKEGLQEIVNIKASLNKGLSDTLKSAFPKTIPVPRPLIEIPENIDPNWLAGFVDGEGSFLVLIRKSSTHKLGEVVSLRFQITQHSRDVLLIGSLVKYLDCGKVYRSREAVDFVVIKLPDLSDKIIPFFEKYPLQGVKSQEFLDFKIVAKLMKNKEHLTQEGLEQIRQVKSGMNTQRK